MPGTGTFDQRGQVRTLGLGVGREHPGAAHHGQSFLVGVGVGFLDVRAEVVAHEELRGPELAALDGQRDVEVPGAALAQVDAAGDEDLTEALVPQLFQAVSSSTSTCVWGIARALPAPPDYDGSGG